MAPRARFVPGNPLWCPRRMREKNPWHSRFLWNSPQQGWQENMEKFRFEPMDAQMDLLCLSRKITSHTEAEPSPALPLPAPSQISKGRAEGISSQKEYQDLILLGGKNPHQTQTSSSCLEIQGWQGAADGATSIWSRKAAGGDPAGQDPAGKSSLAQTEPPLTPQMW